MHSFALISGAMALWNSQLWHLISKYIAYHCTCSKCNNTIMVCSIQLQSITSTCIVIETIHMFILASQRCTKHHHCKTAKNTRAHFWRLLQHHPLLPNEQWGIRECLAVLYSRLPQRQYCQVLTSLQNSLDQLIFLHLSLKEVDEDLGSPQGMKRHRQDTRSLQVWLHVHLQLFGKWLQSHCLPRLPMLFNNISTQSGESHLPNSLLWATSCLVSQVSFHCLIYSTLSLRAALTILCVKRSLVSFWWPNYIYIYLQH